MKSYKIYSKPGRPEWSSFFVLHLFFFAGFASQAFAQQADLGKFEKQVQTAIVKARPASVYLNDYDPKTKTRIGHRFSGVVVNADGIILTAAHASGPDKTYLVTFPDGKEYTATGLGRIAAVDASILKINEKGKWPFAEMGWSSSLKVNEPCLSIAYPASFDANKLVVRFGYVAEVSSTEKANSIRTTCLMEPGDSGGPAFDLLGRVIGIHSSINYSLESNYEVPVDLFRKYWHALQQPEDYKDLPIGEQIPADTLAAAKLAFNNLELLRPAISKLEAQYQAADLKISSTVKGKSQTIIGTLISLHGIAPAKQTSGKSFILSKNSMVGDNPSIDLGKGKIEMARIVTRDERKDLVLLELESHLKDGIVLTALAADTLTLADLGEFLISPQPDAKAIWSVAGTSSFNLPMILRAGYSGSAAVLKEGKVVLGIVQPYSAASAAKLKVGDQVLSINGVTIDSPEHYITEMRKNNPGDVVALVRSSAGITDTLKMKLGKFPAVISHHPAETFTGGKSNFRDGYDHVFVHDAKVTPAECGGPVFDIRGRFVGMNMARYSRTSCIVVTVAELRNFIAKSYQLNTAGI